MSCEKFSDFGIWYTIGVAEPCKAIKKDVSKVYDYANKWNVQRQDFRLWGASHYCLNILDGVDAHPICLDKKDTEEIIQALKWLKPSCGGIRNRYYRYGGSNKCTKNC